jgi:hypothetical protein
MAEPEAEMSANEAQVGGTHYKTEGKPEHWDLVILYQWDYFQGQVFKYLMRWKAKHRSKELKLEDLKKARHFLDKYIESYEKFLPQELTPTQQIMKNDLLDPISRSPTKGIWSDEEFSCEGWLGSGDAVFQDRKTRLEYLGRTLQEAYQKRDEGTTLLTHRPLLQEPPEGPNYAKAT